MSLTPHLRFVERVVPAPEHGEGIGKKVRILQQWYAAEGWEHPDLVKAGGQWEDVRLQAETDEGPL